MRKGLSMLMIAFILLMITGCTGTKETGTTTDKGSSSEPKKGGTFIVSIDENVDNLNPDANGGQSFYPMAQNIFSRLIKINNEQKIIPDLAKDWVVSEDGTEITFNLNTNVKWHDGKDFSCNDVKWTLDTIKANNGFAVGNLKNIKEVSCTDANTTVIQLNHADVTFLGNLAWYGTFILPEHVYSGDNWEAGTSIDPVGSGPFKFEKFDNGKSMTLVRNDDYFGHVPYVDKVIFSIIPDENTMMQAFLNGDVDSSELPPPTAMIQQMKDDPSIVVDPNLFPARYYIAFNFAEKPFDNLKARQAVAYALDNNDIVNKAMNGLAIPAEYFLSPVYDWAVTDDYKVTGYDPKKAEDLLKEAGYTKNKDGFYFDVSFDVYEYSAFVDVAKVVQYQLKQIGINVKLNVLEFAAWSEKVQKNKNFNMAITNGYHGPDVGSIAFRVASDGTNNFSGYHNSDLDKLLSEGSQLYDEETRAPLYKDVQRILSEDLPIYPIADENGFLPYKSYVKGHPTSDEAIDYTGFSEFNYVWLDN
ncbi:ABC transporter substrate-binding protein [Bacillus sp. 31A1R]|uniref:ABC transporter substrate-binding protein n=1 Tax=Robertmurraya mangrovi TaxID=3098077 RepID=A0ABU5IYY4_9BACI|nr:ABC transporter substrate-binding protein [Bacillus sp. 31A1R]MDZ5472321.1 ABC transporter substrate-binding protein [Bacillus sp. 31A1R]